MNIPFRVSDLQSSSLGLTGESPIPTSGYTAITDALDVRGYNWVEFVLVLAGNTGPLTDLHAKFEYSEDSGTLANLWMPVTVEDVDGATGAADQIDYAPSRIISGATPLWRIPLPVLGQQMRMLFHGTGTSSPATVTAFGYRRSR